MAFSDILSPLLPPSYLSLHEPRALTARRRQRGRQRETIGNAHRGELTRHLEEPAENCALVAISQTAHFTGKRKIPCVSMRS